MYTTLGTDKGFYKLVNSELVVGLPDGTPNDFKGREVILVVDTGIWFVWHEGTLTWYPQL